MLPQQILLIVDPCGVGIASREERRAIACTVHRIEQLIERSRGALGGQLQRACVTGKAARLLPGRPGAQDGNASPAQGTDDAKAVDPQTKHDRLLSSRPHVARPLFLSGHASQPTPAPRTFGSRRAVTGFQHGVAFGRRRPCGGFRKGLCCTIGGGGISSGRKTRVRRSRLRSASRA